MNREQAIKIQKHLLDACEAMDRARMVSAGLGKEERLRLGDELQWVVSDLQSELLSEIYDQYPDLEPPREEPKEPIIFNSPRWGEVQLPESVSESDFDAIILSVMSPRWKKVAMIVGLAFERCEELGLPISHDVIAARIQALSVAGRIEDIGDLRMWYNSEVRLKA